MEIDIFLNEKHALLSSNLVPRTLKIAFLGLWNFKIFWGGTRFDPPPPSPRKWDQRSFVDTVGYSIQTAISIFIETPEYFIHTL